MYGSVEPEEVAPTLRPRDVLREMRDRGALPDVSRSAFVSGEAVRGWDYGSTVLHVDVVSDAPWQGRREKLTEFDTAGGSIPIDTFRSGARRWEVRYWRTSQLDALLDLVSWPSYDAGRLDGELLTQSAVELLSRLAHGKSLMGGQWFGDRRQAVLDSALLTLLVSRCLDMTDLALDDAARHLSAGDIQCAALSARLAFEYAADALLASCGEFGHRPDQRPRLFRLVRQDVLSFEDYWRFETMTSYAEQVPRAWIGEALKVCRHIALTISVR